MAPDPTKVADLYQKKGTSRTAGEVRFIKDRGSDHAEWGWGTPGPSERAILPDFVFNPKYLKPLAKSMRSSLMALGHMISSYNAFTRIKSRNISPDGNLGGQGYIQKIPDMRRQLMNCIEAMSAYTDTVYDELSAPHWNPSEDTIGPRDREEVKEIVEEAEEIREDPEGWADKQPTDSGDKTASAAGLAAHLQVLEDTVSDLRTGNTAEHYIRCSSRILTSSKFVLRDVRLAAGEGASGRNQADPTKVASMYLRQNNV